MSYLVYVVITIINQMYKYVLYYAKRTKYDAS